MACTLLQAYPSFDALKHADSDTLRQCYLSHGRWKPAVIAHRLQVIRDAEPLTTDAAIIQPAVLDATMLAELLGTVSDHIAACDRALAAWFPTHPDAAIFTSLPGAGGVFAPRLLAAFGANRTRIDSAAQVQNTAGISPVTAASGTMRVVHWRPACSKFLRQSVQEYANDSIRHSIWARAYDQRQRERDKEHQAAVRALAFQWIRVIFACWQVHQPYDELRYLRSRQQRHASLCVKERSGVRETLTPSVNHEKQEDDDDGPSPCSQTCIFFLTVHLRGLVSAACCALAPCALQWRRIIQSWLREIHQETRHLPVNE